MKITRQNGTELSFMFKGTVKSGESTEGLQVWRGVLDILSWKLKKEGPGKALSGMLVCVVYSMNTQCLPAPARYCLRQFAEILLPRLLGYGVTYSSFLCKTVIRDGMKI
jgi:hypothetical protein